MIKATLRNPALRKRAQQFGRLVRHSAVTPRTGYTYKPQLVTNGELGVTFIGHASFFVQMGGQNVMLDPNFARWLFVLKRLRKPGLRVSDLPPIDLVLVTHAHFDHLHRPSLRAIVQHTRRRTGIAPTIVVPHHVFDLVSDLGFEEIIEMDWWNHYRHGGLTVTHVPSRHWGARILKDSHRGYGGYVLQYENIPCITREIPRTFPVSAKSASGSRPKSRCCPSGPTIRSNSAPSTPAQETPPARFSISIPAGWCPCTTEASGCRTNRLTNRCNCLSKKRSAPGSRIGWW